MRDYKTDVSIKGDFFGVDLRERNIDDTHIMVDIYSRGVKLWFKDESLSSHWIDDLIKVLTQTKQKLENEYEKEEDGFGYKFKEVE